jgi:sugar lactone lactonase YvrE
LIALCILGCTQVSASGEELFVSKKLTLPGAYVAIEGPAVDTSGNLYAVNFARLGTIGKLEPGNTESTLFATLPEGSVGNGIRIDAANTLFVADYKGHNIFAIGPGQTEPRLYFHSDGFNQPNDLAITKDGTLYASDPMFRRGVGRIWRVARAGDGTGLGIIMKSARTMGTSNGLDLSPDGKTLYVSESNTREVWSYRIDGDRLSAATRLRKFPDGELDGLRTDVDGRIYVTRPVAGKVSLMMPDGTLVREIRLTAANPTNLAFGGPDHRTLYVTQGAGNYFEAFRVDRPGREPCATAPTEACR